MTKKEVLEARLGHLAYDQMLLTYSEKFLDTDEQRSHFELKTKLLEEWVSELTEQIQKL